MSESLKPLLHEDADDFERALLGSAKNAEAPPPGARERAMAAAGLSSNVATASRGSASTHVTTSGGTLVRLALAVAVVASGSVATVSWKFASPSDAAQKSAAIVATSTEKTEREPSSTEVASSPATTVPSALAAAPVAEAQVNASAAVPSAPTTAIAAAASPIPSITPSRLPNARPERAVPAVASARRAVEPSRVESPAPLRADDDALTRETLEVDEARRAVASGDPTRALALLDAHDREFSPAAFALDAAVLRIEALERAGRVGEADRLAQAFLARHVEGSYARRVQAVRDRISGASAR